MRYAIWDMRYEICDMRYEIRCGAPAAPDACVLLGGVMIFCYRSFGLPTRELLAVPLAVQRATPDPPPTLEIAHSPPLT